jgi:hypothetical protein
VRTRLPGAAALPFTIVKEDVSALCAQGPAPDEPACLEGNADVRAADDAIADTVPDVVECDTVGLSRLSSDPWHLGSLSEFSAGILAALASGPLLP